MSVHPLIYGAGSGGGGCNISTDCLITAVGGSRAWRSKLLNTQLLRRVNQSEEREVGERTKGEILLIKGGH